MAIERKQYERLTAKKILIKEITAGSYFRQEGWEPNYIKSPLGKTVSRVNIVGIITNKSTGTDVQISSITIDDGSDNISTRIFDQSITLENVNVGDIVQIIGKPREFGSERYVVPEIIKKIDKNWLIHRKLELEIEYGDTLNSLNDLKAKPLAPKPTEAVEEQVSDESNIFDKIIEYVKLKDKGDGVDVERITSEIKGSESKINELMKLGEIFEVRPGKIKVL